MVSRGGANLVKTEPVFSKDGKRLLVCTACAVTIYSVQTGEILNVLNGHTGVVNSVSVVPVASICHCWTAGLDGTVRFWDFAAGVLLRTVDVGHPVHSMVIPELCKPWEVEKGEGKRKPLVGFLSVGWYKEQKGEDIKGRVVCHNLTTGKSIAGHLAKTRSPQALYASPGGGLVGMVDERKAWIWLVPEASIDGVGLIPSTILHHTRTLTVLAFDFTETRVAAGDASGRILLWENVGDRTFAVIGDVGRVSAGEGIHLQNDTKSDRARGGGVRGNDDAGALTTYHWHAHDVKSLMFTIDGVYLLSGGLERVLVVWQLETGKRNYLPRLGGAVVSIVPSVHPSVCAVACLDNSVKLLNIVTMEIERNFQGIFPAFAVPKQLTVHPSLVSIEPSEGKIVVATNNLSLHFYDIANGKHAAEVQVTPPNYVTGSRDEAEGPSTCVSHVAFSADGSCMATVDVRIAEQGVGDGVCLKFWDRLPGKLKFSVSTQIEEPYEISALSFHPLELMAVSCSNTDFRVWVTHERRSKKFSWGCRSVGSYRQRPILAASFSPDGSVLAVAASEFLTLWNPATNSLIRVLSNTIIQPIQPIHHLAFVNQSNCLVAASSGEKPLLTVWDVSTLSLRWCQLIGVEALSVDPVRASFAVLAGVPCTSNNEGSRSTNAVVVLFAVETPAPLQYWTVRDGLRGALLFNPVSQSWTEASSVDDGDDSKMADLVPLNGKLTFISCSREFVVFDPYQRGEEPEQPVIRYVSVPEEVSSAFTIMYGNAVGPTKNDSSPEVRSALHRAPWGTLLNGPSLVLPSLSAVCIPFIDSLMRKRT